MPRHRGFCQPMAGSPLPSNPESALTQDSGHYRQFLGSTSAIRKSDLLVSISLLLVSKSHFLVADELASFSDNLSTLRRTQPVQARCDRGPWAVWQEPARRRHHRYITRCDRKTGHHKKEVTPG